MMRSRFARRGFTLIELLVVIAIIGLLAAILFPAFARARENARRSSCQSNLKQMALGVIQYTQDFDERSPPSFPGVRVDFYASGGFNAAPVPPASGEPGALHRSNIFDASPPNEVWVNGNYRTFQDLIFPYVKSSQIFSCPSARYDRTLIQYGYSDLISGVNRYDADPTGKCCLPMSLAEVKRPAEIVMLMDFNAVAAVTSASASTYASLLGDPAEIALFPHLEGSNLAFTDGHVKWYPKRGVITFPASRANRYWNPFLD
jgi:prepilin-type N-terminal cleavage/methylation domain-containing protein/prepilin-type processing-associated H-X9-DG protein